MALFVELSNREIVLEPGRAELNYWRDLWRYRELFEVLAWRDVAVRYKQTVIGLAWAVIRPLLTMLVFHLVFHRIARLPSDGLVPYPLFVFAAMLPWTLFATAITDAANSLVSNSNLISKVYFPRMIVPTAAIMVSVIDFAIGLGLLTGLMIWYQFVPNWKVLWLPVFTLLTVLASLGPGLWIASLNVKYRDFRYIVPFIVQFGLYISPVGFSAQLVPERYQSLLALNPMVGIIGGFRWSLLGSDVPLRIDSLVIGTAVIVVMLLVGIRQFRRMERQFADLM
jgi:lipopolysaccharide transport system permease protein